jgi:hypothetical protein
MLSGPQSTKTLERLLADPQSFTQQAIELKTEPEAMSANQWTALSSDVRLLLAVAALKVSLAQQHKALGGYTFDSLEIF